MLCCLCGTSMEYNAAAMCLVCLSQQVDITEGINTDMELISCGKCGRWHTTGDNWMHMEAESLPLLAHCMKKLSLEKHKCKVLDSLFVWTEPHSKRLKIAVNIEKHVLDEKIRLSQRVVIEFVIKPKQCMECIREATDHTWGARVQVRQRLGGSKRALHQLEALLAKAGLFNLMMNVQVIREGFDMYFKSKNQAERVIETILSAMPGKKSRSSSVVSKDIKSNTHKVEVTWLIEIVPLSKHDLIIAPKALTGNRFDLMLLHKLSSNIHLISPTTLAKTEINAGKFFASPFSAISTTADLVEYIVLDINLTEGYGGKADIEDTESVSTTVSRKDKELPATLAECEVARADGDFSDTFLVLTHLGHLLNPGDSVMGYDISRMDKSAFEQLPFDVPDVVLVRKVFSKEGNISNSGSGTGADAEQQKKFKKKKKNKPAPWMTKILAAQAEEASNNVVTNAEGRAIKSDVDVSDYVESSGLQNLGLEDLENLEGNYGSEDEYSEYDVEEDEGIQNIQ